MITGQSETFECYRYSVPTKNKRTHTLVAFGDVHRYGKLCSDDRWLKFLREARSIEHPLFLGMGDYLDMFSGSERRAIRNDDLHEQSIDTLEKFYYERLDQFAEEIGFMAPHLVGLLEGNHHMKFQDGTTSTQYLCRKLKCKYLGNQCFVRLSFQRTTINGTAVYLTLFASHGLSSMARTVSGGFNAVEKMELVAEADIFLMGHNHQRGAIPFSKVHLLDLPGGLLKVVERRGYFVRTGSFMRSYVPGERSYTANRLLRPADLGPVPINITFVREYANQHGENPREEHRLDVSVTI